MRWGALPLHPGKPANSEAHEGMVDLRQAPSGDIIPGGNQPL